MKLYYSPGACSFAPHVVAKTAGIPVELVKVDGMKKVTQHGEDFWAINPKGYVPALQLDDGSVLTEGPVISQYLADQKPDSKLMPAAGTMARYRVQEVLGYINSEIHKSYSPLFTPNTSDAVKEERKAYLTKRYKMIEDTLAKQQYIAGDHFTVADAYLYTVTTWAGYVKLDLSAYPNLAAYQKRISERPEVQAAHAAERG